MTTIAAADAELCRWLRRLAAEHDLTLPAPHGDPRAAGLRGLVAVISREFRQYRAIVESVSAAVARNDEQLAGVAEATAMHVKLVRETRAATAEATAGTGDVAEAADALAAFVSAADGHASSAAMRLSAMRDTLEAVEARLRAGEAPFEMVTQATAEIAGFLSSLTQLARQAQLLGMNAAIEAAHLADAGRRFTIVAQEVRALSTSTHDSAGRVATLVSDMRSAGSSVAGAITASLAEASSARGDVEAASLTLSGAHAGIGALTEAIIELTGTAGAQNGALRSVVDAMDAIAAHAEEASASAQLAAGLDLGAVRRRAIEDVSRWKLAPDVDVRISGDDAFSRWVVALAAGTARLDDAPPFDADDALAGEAVRELIEAVDASQRGVHLAVAELATGVARNGFAWDEIGRSLTNLGAQLATVRAALGDASAGANDAARISGSIRQLAEEMQGGFADALDTVDRALARIDGAARSVEDIGRHVEAAVEASTRADGVLDVIDHISSETDLLALNAAIEAAHAGDDGRAFSVIASEIRLLALSTTDSARNVARLLAGVRDGGQSLRVTFAGAAEQTASVDEGAHAVRTAIGALRSDLDDAV
ncbi:MAG: methyl-accepting chemotaxis protein, partial [Candidatus Eremiobacteraeota bacterium]|nr:methyl-accepting chemotaxis protein [Candidatus Eremiobacteraeota bacterium]